MTSRLTRLHGRLLHVNLDACTVHLFSADLAHLPPRIFVRKMRFRCLVAGSFSETVRPQREAVDDLNKRKTVRHTMTWSRSHDRHCRRPALCLALCWRRNMSRSCPSDECEQRAGTCSLLARLRRRSAWNRRRAPRLGVWLPLVPD